jgi:hypothetical protein
MAIIQSLASPIRYVSFSGGGWNTHTANSGFIGSVLQAANLSSGNPFELKQLFVRQNGAGGNSGGSWFLTMLAYSDQFASALANSPEDWFTTEYMAIQEQIFSTPSNETFDAAIEQLLNTTILSIIESTELYTVINNLIRDFPTLQGYEQDFAEFITKSIVNSIVKRIDFNDLILELPESSFAKMLATQGATSELDWLTFVGNTAFSAYGMKEQFKDQKFGSERNNWAENLSLVFPGSYNSSEVLNYNETLGVGLENFVNSFTSNIDSSIETFDFNQIILPASLVVPGTNGSNGNLYNLVGNGTAAYERRNYRGVQDSIKNSFSDSYSLELSLLEAVTLSGAFAGDFSSISTLRDVIFNNVDQHLTSLNLRQFIKDWAFNELKLNSNWFNDRVNDVTKAVIDSTVDTVLSDSDQKKVTDFLANSLAPIFGGFVKNLAVPLSFANNQATYAYPVEDGSVDTLRSNQNYRYIDGGYTDNTAVANIISNIQNDYGTEQNFDLTFFINTDDTAIVPAFLTGADNPLTVASDLPKLFGGGKTEADWQAQDSAAESFVRRFDLGGLGSVDAAYPYVFDQSAWIGKTQADWEYSKGDTHLAYYRLDVETIDNPLWNIQKGQHGEINVFMTWNQNTKPGPLKPDIFDIYEEIYNTVRDGVLNQGGYIYLLGAFDIINLNKRDTDKIQFEGEDNFTHKFQVDFSTSNTDFLNLIEIYKNDANGDRTYLGAIGGAATERSFEYDYRPNVFTLEAGEWLDFTYFSKQAETTDGSQLVVNETSKNHYSLQVIDSATSQTLATAQMSFVPIGSQEDSISVDDTKRDSSDDTYFLFEAGEKLNVTVDAIAAMRNRLGMLKIDLDALTGQASYQGQTIDTDAFERAVLNSLNNDSTGFGIKTLDPYTKSDYEWVVPEEGYYTPVLLTEAGNLFVLGHDRVTNSTHARILGENTVAFEDLGVNQNSDFDFNDALITFNPL